LVNPEICDHVDSWRTRREVRFTRCESEQGGRAGRDNSVREVNSEICIGTSCGLHSKHVIGDNRFFMRKQIPPNTTCSYVLGVPVQKNIIFSSVQAFQLLHTTPRVRREDKGPEIFCPWKSGSTDWLIFRDAKISSHTSLGIPEGEH
jgi:hypothetical protein